MSRRTTGPIVALAVAVAAVGCGGTRTVTVRRTAEPGLGPPRVRSEFGHIASLKRRGGHFELRFDPAWLLSGETANIAAAEDGAVEPGEPVPNDNYVVDEGHRLLTYRVPPNARVSVLTRHGDPAQNGATPVTVAELARIVAGTSRVKLFEPLDSGVWITTDVDAVRAIRQQYRP
jgi:hypothetical protein